MSKRTTRPTQTAPASAVEVQIWLDAVGIQLTKRQDDIAQKWDELRRESGVVGGVARFVLYDNRPEPDAEMLAGAIQDVQVALLDPNDQLGLRAALPQMAERLSHERGTASFLAAVERYDGQPIPFAGIQSAAIPLLAKANELLRAHGLQPNSKLEAIAAHNGPIILSRLTASILKRRMRKLLFATALGTNVKIKQPRAAEGLKLYPT